MFQQFLEHDKSWFSHASRGWPHLLDSLYPGLQSIPDLAQKLACVTERTFANRENPTGRLPDFLEFWCGAGNLTRSLLESGLHGFGFDINMSSAHDCLCRQGLRLWLNMLASVRQHGLIWLGPPCSSFVVLCRCQSQREASNDYMGDQTRQFVQVGNAHMSVAALIFLLACVTGLSVVLEQPESSVMCLCPAMASVLQFARAFPVKTYLGCFGGSSVKPLQLWTNKLQFLDLARDRPASVDLCAPDSQPLVVRGADGSFTGVKDKLVESQVYTHAFGRAVTQAFVRELELRS